MSFGKTKKQRKKRYDVLRYAQIVGLITAIYVLNVRVISPLKHEAW